MDIRTKKLAQLIVKYSVFIKHGENVIISGSTEAEEFIKALYEEIIKVGGHPILRLTLPGLTHCFYKNAQKLPKINRFSARFFQKSFFKSVKKLLTVGWYGEEWQKVENMI